MLIIQKLEENQFTENEKIVADYLVKHQNEILHLSISKIAKETYTAPSTIVRVANKVGLKGWKELKAKIIEEGKYIHHNNSIDANIPFHKYDDFETISHSIAELCISSIEDTINYLNHDQLQKSVYMLYNAKKIQIFGITNTISCAYDFALKMRGIGRVVQIYSNPEDFPYIIDMTGCNTVSIFISYSGQTPELLEYALQLKSKKLPTLAITSIGENTLSVLCDEVLYVTTREKMYSKISNFASNQSIVMILNILYSCIFSLNYDQNWQHRIDLAKKIEYRRQSDVSILKEED